MKCSALLEERSANSNQKVIRLKVGTRYRSSVANYKNSIVGGKDADNERNLGTVF